MRLDTEAARLLLPWLSHLQPRKLPRQARSQASFDAIVDACAQLLANGSYDSLTTNSISERAGVSIGTLYEYFPNRESIVAALAAASSRRLVERMQRAAQDSARLGDFAAIEHLLAAGVEAMRAPDSVFRVLMKDAPFVVRLPVFQDARSALDEICQEIGRRSAHRLCLPEPHVDVWLISQMLFSAMLEIACLEAGDADRKLRIRELARLTFRMGLGRDVAPEEVDGFDGPISERVSAA